MQGPAATRPAAPSSITLAVMPMCLAANNGLDARLLKSCTAQGPATHLRFTVFSPTDGIYKSRQYLMGS